MSKRLYALFNDPAVAHENRKSLSPDTFVQFVTESPFTGTPKLKEFKDNSGNVIKYNLVMDWHDLEHSSWEFVEFLAQKATEQFGTLYVPTKRGEQHFGVAEVPRIGDAVSYTINGDYTPCGFVERLTPTLTVITTTGQRFRRLKQTGAWVREGTDYIYLVGGHIDERNPEV